MTNPTRLSKRHKTKLLDGIRYASNLSAQEQLPLYTELKDLLINGNKASDFHQAVSTEFTGNPVGYIGFIYQLAKRYNSQINRKDYSVVYSAFCGKGIAPETARRVSSHLTTLYHKTQFPVSEDTVAPVTQPTENTTQVFSEMLTSLSDQVNHLREMLEALNTTVVGNTSALSVMRKEIDSVVEQVQDLEQGNLRTPESNNASFDNFLSNLPSNSNLTITINK